MVLLQLLLLRVLLQKLLLGVVLLQLRLLLQGSLQHGWNIRVVS